MEKDPAASAEQVIKSVSSYLFYCGLKCFFIPGPLLILLLIVSTSIFKHFWLAKVLYPARLIKIQQFHFYFQKFFVFV